MFGQLFNFSKINQYILITKLQAHERPVNCLAFSPGGELLVSGGDDEDVRVWDLNTVSQLQTLSDQTGNWGQITCLMFLELGSGAGGADWLCIGTGRGRLVVYRRTKKQTHFTESSCTRAFGPGDSVESIAFDAKNRRLAATSHNGMMKMYTFNLGSLAQLWTTEYQDVIPRVVRFSDNGDNVVIYRLENGQVLCCDAQTSTEKYKKSLKTSIGNLDECRTTGYFIVDNLEDGFDLYPPSRMSPALEYKIPTTRRFVKKAVVGEKGRMIACGSDHGLVYLFSPDDTNPVQVLRHGGDLDLIQVVEAVTTGDHHVIATASASPDFSICLWKQPIKKAATAPNRRKRKTGASSSHLLNLLIGLNLIIFVAFMGHTFGGLWLPIVKNNVGLAASAFSGTLRSIQDSIVDTSAAEPKIWVEVVERQGVAKLIANLDDTTLRKLLLQRLGEEVEDEEGDEGDEGEEGDGKDIDERDPALSSLCIAPYC